MRRILVGFGDTISSLGLTVAAACLILIVIINGANVVARYVFFAAFSWAEEAMLFLMITGVFWGAIAVAWRGVDIRIDAFVTRAPGRAQTILSIFATLISIGILIWVVLLGHRVILQIFNFDQRSHALNLPMWIPHSAFASGLLLVILMTVARLFVPARSDTRAPGKDG